MPAIGVRVYNKHATNISDTTIVCGNSDYEVLFEFDAEWDAYPVKTARFIWDGKREDVIFEGSTCPVPVVTNTFMVAVGVFAGDVRTTTPAYISAAKSITDAGGTPAPPSENVYAQIMALLNADAVKIAGLETSVATLEKGAEAQGKDITELKQSVADLMYQAVDITAFSNDSSTVEMGSTVTDVVLAWEINKIPDALTLDGEEIEPALTGKTLTGQSITGKKTWTLEATDERGATDSKTTSITFVNAAYYGAAAAPEMLDNAFVLSLTKKLTDTRKRTITVDAAEGQHIWYAVPVRLGACTFKVGGFVGGFDLVATVDFTNSHGYTEPYYIYRTSQTGLGETTVEVS